MISLSNVDFKLPVSFFVLYIFALNTLNEFLPYSVIKKNKQGLSCAKLILAQLDLAAIDSCHGVTNKTYFRNLLRDFVSG